MDEQVANPGEPQLVMPEPMQGTPEFWLGAFLCIFGRHQGPWIYAAEGNCAQGRECERCGAVYARIKHRHEWRYKRECCCQGVIMCVRCNLTYPETTRHDWGKSHMVQPNFLWLPQKDSHQCLRCGETEVWIVAQILYAFSILIKKLLVHYQIYTFCF